MTIAIGKRKTTRGMKLCRWTEREIFELQRLYRLGNTSAQIASATGMTRERVRSRIDYEVMVGHLRGRRRASGVDLLAEKKTARTFKDPVLPGPRPTSELLRLRDARLQAPPRDLAGALFGDPPVGFSALEGA